MRRTLDIAMREFKQRVYTLGFWFSTLALPFLMSAVLLVTILAGQERPTKLVIIEVDPVHLREDLTKKLDDDLLFEVLPSTATLDALDQQVLQGTLDAVLVLDRATMRTGGAQLRALKPLQIKRKSRLDRKVRGAVIRDVLLQQRLDPDGFDNAKVSFHSLKQGTTSKAMSEAQKIRLMVGGFGVIHFLLFLGIYPLLMLQAIAEERQSGLVEVLLAVATPRQILVGKTLGLAAMATLQVLLWIGPGALFVVAGVALSPTYLMVAINQLDEVLVAGICIALGFAAYTSGAALLGVLASSKQQAENLQMLILLPPMLGSIAAMAALEAPNTWAALLFAVFPPTANMVTYTRYVAGVPWWQTVLCMVLSALTTVMVARTCVRGYPLAALGAWRPTLRRPLP